MVIKSLKSPHVLHAMTVISVPPYDNLAKSLSGTSRVNLIADIVAIKCPEKLRKFYCDSFLFPNPKNSYCSPKLSFWLLATVQEAVQSPATLACTSNTSLAVYNNNLLRSRRGFRMFCQLPTLPSSPLSQNLKFTICS